MGRLSQIGQYWKAISRCCMTKSIEAERDRGFQRALEALLAEEMQQVLVMMLQVGIASEAYQRFVKRLASSRRHQD